MTFREWAEELRDKPQVSARWRPALVAGIEALDEMENALGSCAEAVSRDVFDPNDDGDHVLHAQGAIEAAKDAAQHFWDVYNRCFLGE